MRAFRRRGRLATERLGIRLGLVLAACTPWQPPHDDAQADQARCATEAAPVSAGEPMAVITTLRTRDHEMAIGVGEDGLRFTVSSVAGEVLATGVSEAELQQRFPALHQRYGSVFADGGIWLDARIEPMQVPAHAEAGGPTGLDPRAP